MASPSTAQFFKEMVSVYDDLIQRHVPCYGDLFWALFHYLPQDFQPQEVLELGCGTGNLTLAISKCWPQAHITAVDMVPEMLAETRPKVPGATLVESSFQALDLPEGKFDVILSSLALHHLLDHEKGPFFKKCRDWLKPGGFMVFADCTLSNTDRLSQINVDLLIELNKQQGLTPEELEQTWVHRNTHDHYASLDDLTRWLRDAGRVLSALRLFPGPCPSTQTSWSLPCPPSG